MKKSNGIMMAILAFCIVASVIGLVKLFRTETSPAVDTTEIASPFFSSFLNKGPGIGVVKVYGPIFTQSESSFIAIPDQGADGIVRNLEKFRKDSRVKAVVLRVNSPGGTIGASQEITDAVIRLKEDGKKVIVSMGDMAASGGYYIAAMADKIVANRGTVTGSIGVLTAGYNFSELMKKYGVRMNVIKQGKNKDLMAFWRDMEPEERQILENLGKYAYNQFLEIVSKGRNIPKEELLKIADGRVMTGEQALEVGLVDTLGGFADAVKIAATEVGLDPDNPNLIVTPENSFQRFFEMLGQEARSDQTVNFMRLVATNQVPVLYYSSVPLPLHALDFVQ
ncbi:signal peptide peptidase SppA [bacterium]|nr:signal peptide peptidase SppA [bacterium]